ncbi:MAG: DinB family protein [Acidobacteria bacterium]|nr:DinB family protein [Acidobacteriota bacterium]
MNMDSFVSNWRRIHKQTTKIMAAAPNDKYDWKPCDSAMSLGELMNHLWIAEAGLVAAAKTGSFPKEMPPQIKDTAALIAAFDKTHEEAIATAKALTSEELAESVAPFGPDKAMSRMTLLHLTHEHEIHHRGQLYTYLRIAGCEVPPLFG